MNTSTVLGKTLVFVGLSLAVLLAAAGMRTNRTTTKFAGNASSLTELDLRARPFFEEAQRNVPAAVAKLTESKTSRKSAGWKFAIKRPVRRNRRSWSSDRGKIVETRTFSTIGVTNDRCGLRRDGTYQTWAGGILQKARFSTDTHECLSRKGEKSELKSLPRFFHDFSTICVTKHKKSPCFTMYEKW